MTLPTRPGFSGVEPNPPRSLVGRDSELATVERLLHQGRSLVLVGAVGIGKTTLCEAILDARGRLGHPVVMVRARSSVAELPLGPFAGLLSDEEARLQGLPLLLAARSAVLAHGAGSTAPVVVGVDDAHLLDPLSAILVHQLVLDGSALVVLTVAEGQWAPDPVTELWRSGRIERCVVGRLGDEAVAAMVGEAAAAIAPETAQRIVTLSGGNPLFVSVLARAAAEYDDTATSAPPVGLAGSATLADFVDGKLHGVSARGRDALSVIALAEPLGAAVLAELVDEATLQELERDGWVQLVHSGRRLEVRLVHAIYGEVLRGSMSRLLARSIYRELIRAVESRGARRRDDLLRIAVWSVDGGQPTTGRQVLRAAHQASAAGDFVLAGRLAAHVWRQEGSPAAARTLVLVGNAPELEAPTFAERLWAAASTERDRALSAWSLGYDAMWRRGDVAGAVAALERALQHVEDRSLRQFLLSRMAVNRAFAGHGVAALDGLSGIDATDPWIQAGVVVARLVTATHVGDPTEEVAEAERFLTDSPPRPDLPAAIGPGLVRALVARALVQMGQLHRAESVARAGVESTEASRLTAGIPSMQLGWTLICRGRPGEGFHWLREASAAHAARRLSMLEGWGLASLAFAAAYAGRRDSASEALDRLAGRDGWGVYAADVWHARSALCTLSGDVAGAVGHARCGLDHARATGAAFDEALFAYALVRLAAATDDDHERLGELGARLGGLAGLFAVSATSVARGDAVASGEVAEAFAEAGAANLAAAAAADAGRLARAGGDVRLAEEWDRRARVMVAGSGIVHEFLAVPRSGLTRRSHAVARAVADGQTLEQVAARLLVTVDGARDLLESAMVTLGVTAPEQLADALAAQG